MCLGVMCIAAFPPCPAPFSPRQLSLVLSSFFGPYISPHPGLQQPQRHRDQISDQANFLRKVYLTTVVLRHFRAWNRITDNGQRVMVRAGRASNARVKGKADRLFRCCFAICYAIVCCSIVCYSIVCLPWVLLFFNVLETGGERVPVLAEIVVAVAAVVVRSGDGGDSGGGGDDGDDGGGLCS